MTPIHFIPLFSLSSCLRSGIPACQSLEYLLLYMSRPSQPCLVLGDRFSCFFLLILSSDRILHLHCPAAPFHRGCISNLSTFSSQLCFGRCFHQGYVNNTRSLWLQRTSSHLKLEKGEFTGIAHIHKTHKRKNRLSLSNTPLHVYAFTCVILLFSFRFPGSFQ